MSKFNKQKTVNEIVEGRTGATVNHEGGLAYTPENKVKLVKMAATSLVGENKFYTSGEESDSEIINLVHSVSKEDPEFILKLAVYCREVLNLRSAPILLTAELANSGVNGIPNSRKYVERVIQRADEITEMVGYQLNRNSKAPRKSKLPMLIKNGVAMSFNKFNEYQFAKYNRDGDVTLKDALFMTHPKPKNSEQQELFDKIVNDNLEIPETWETYISANGSNKQTWTHIAPKLPIFALTRNLRNLLQNDVSTDLYLDKLSDPETIRKSRMLPFRFHSAYKTVKEQTPNSMDQRVVLDALETAIEISTSNISTIKGKTAIFIDVSGSMSQQISRQSTVTCMDISTLFGALADGICEKSVCGVFGQDFAVVNPSKRAPVFSKQREFLTQHVGHSTNGWKAMQWLLDERQEVDRVLVFSDEQLYNSGSYYGRNETIQSILEQYRRSVNPNTFLHSIDLAGYSTTMVAENDSKSNLISGWSEQILKYIDMFEKGFGTMVNDVENYEVK